MLLLPCIPFHLLKKKISKSLDSWTRYTTTERELLVIVETLKVFRNNVTKTYNHLVSYIALSSRNKQNRRNYFSTFVVKHWHKQTFAANSKIVSYFLNYFSVRESRVILLLFVEVGRHVTIVINPNTTFSPFLQWMIRTDFDESFSSPWWGATFVCFFCLILQSLLGLHSLVIQSCLWLSSTTPLSTKCLILFFSLIIIQHIT